MYGASESSALLNCIVVFMFCLTIEFVALRMTPPQCPPLSRGIAVDYIYVLGQTLNHN